MGHMTHQILWVVRPKQQCNTEGQWLVNQVKANSTRLSSLKDKEKDVTKKQE